MSITDQAAASNVEVEQRLRFDEGLADTAVPGTDVRDCALKFFDAFLGHTLRAIFTAIANINQFAFGDIVIAGRLV